MTDGFFILSGRPYLSRSHLTALRHAPGHMSAERIRTNPDLHSKSYDLFGMESQRSKVEVKHVSDIDAETSDHVGLESQSSRSLDRQYFDSDLNSLIHSAQEGRGPKYSFETSARTLERLHTSISEPSLQKKNENQVSLSSGCCGAGHVPVNMMGVRKGCVYCQLTKSKTRSGYWVYTRYRCKECEVPLCMPSAERDCFQLYHKYLKDGSLQPPTLYPDN